MEYLTASSTSVSATDIPFHRRRMDTTVPPDDCLLDGFLCAVRSAGSVRGLLGASPMVSSGSELLGDGPSCTHLRIDELRAGGAFE
jgi:hypothetical protein